MLNLLVYAQSLLKLLRHPLHFPAMCFICKSGCNKEIQCLQAIAFV